MVDLKELHALHPEEREQKLKDLITEREKKIVEEKEAIEKAKKLAQETKRENELLALEKKIALLRDSSSFDTSSEVVEEGDLEETLLTEIPEKVEKESSAVPSDMYISKEVATGQIYSSVFSMYEAARDEGSVSPEMIQTMQVVQYAIEKKEEDIRAGVYTPSDEIAHQANSLKRLADHVLSLYSPVSRRDSYF